MGCAGPAQTRPSGPGAGRGAEAIAGEKALEEALWEEAPGAGVRERGGGGGGGGAVPVVLAPDVEHEDTGDEEEGHHQHRHGAHLHQVGFNNSFGKFG